jgi:hypothetical protein
MQTMEATDAPPADRNLGRLARRAAAGVARTGCSFSNGSGHPWVNTCKLNLRPDSSALQQRQWISFCDVARFRETVRGERTGEIRIMAY